MMASPVTLRPMFEADDLGLPAILRDMQEVSDRHGPGWEVAPLLVELAANGGSFAALKPRRKR